MNVPRRSLRALGAALAAGALLTAASTAHADVPQRPAGAPGPRTLNPQPEPPGVLHHARAAAGFSSSIALKRGKNNDMGIVA
jgi:hypothetical protein